MRAPFVEIRGRRAHYGHLQLFSFELWRRIYLRSHQGGSVKFAPMVGGLELTPLRAYAHQVPHYYVQRVGTAVSHPDTNDYAGFAQDTIRATEHFGVSLGVRNDLQSVESK